MAASDEPDYELLTEHFGYPPAALLDDIINTVNVLADRALDSVERLLLSRRCSTPPSTATSTCWSCTRCATS
ncbi:hypothetical protein CDD83_6425 [Cordyceps sp. RAO-2017]|nr:hypothetical protein CDD83_6425 [Cordyceps sp. RAO-2017]